MHWIAPIEKDASLVSMEAQFGNAGDQFRSALHVNVVEKEQPKDMVSIGLPKVDNANCL